MNPSDIASVRAQRDQMKGHASDLVMGANKPVMISAARTVNNQPVIKNGISKSVTSVGI